MIARTILLVDDDVFPRRALERALARKGHRVISVDSGAHALEALDRQPVEIVISDHRMSGMMGLDLLREVKARHPGVCRVFSSGSVQPEDNLDALRSGALVLRKPWTLEDVDRVISEAEALLACNGIARPDGGRERGSIGAEGSA